MPYRLVPLPPLDLQQNTHNLAFYRIQILFYRVPAIEYSDKRVWWSSTVSPDNCLDGA